MIFFPRSFLTNRPSERSLICFVITISLQTAADVDEMMIVTHNIIPNKYFTNCIY